MKNLMTSWEELYGHIQENALPIVDTRSESEYANGHIPSAYNIALLSDHERQHIGTIYKQQGHTSAVQAGLEIFASKAEFFSQAWEKYLSEKSSRSLVIYCARGGMRSKLVGAWLKVLGFSPFIITGGYKWYRGQVLEILNKFSEHPLLVLNGKTGSGKTELIEALINRSYPAIDFERLARHRGSVFGGLAQETPPPSQQQFENELAEAYLKVKHHPRICVEVESSIGDVHLLKSVRKNITRSPMVFITRPPEQRVASLIKTYTKNWDKTSEEIFIHKMEILGKFMSKNEKQEIISDVQKGHFADAIEKILRLRYDKTYAKSLERFLPQRVATIDMSQGIEWACQIISQYLMSQP